MLSCLMQTWPSLIYEPFQSQPLWRYTAILSTFTSPASPGGASGSGVGTLTRSPRLVTNHFVPQIITQKRPSKLHTNRNHLVEKSNYLPRSNSLKRRMPCAAYSSPSKLPLHVANMHSSFAKSGPGCSPATSSSWAQPSPATSPSLPTPRLKLLPVANSSLSPQSLLATFLSWLPFDALLLMLSTSTNAPYLCHLQVPNLYLLPTEVCGARTKVPHGFLHHSLSSWNPSRRQGPKLSMYTITTILAVWMIPMRTSMRTSTRWRSTRRTTTRSSSLLSPTQIRSSVARTGPTLSSPLPVMKTPLTQVMKSQVIRSQSC